MCVERDVGRRAVVVSIEGRETKISESKSVNGIMKDGVVI